MSKPTKSTVFSGANGTITFNPGWRYAWQQFTIHGGPFPKYEASKSGNTFGVNLRAEARHPCDLHLPIKDFGNPDGPPEKVAAAITLTIHAAMLGLHGYVGCAGGWGRTGLFLSLVAKALGEDAPVEFVRRTYGLNAVETRGQEQYVAHFDVEALRKEMRACAWRYRLRSLWPF